MWLPPTPPSEECNDYYTDEVLDMSYNIQTVISPSLLSSIAFYRYVVLSYMVIKLHDWEGSMCKHLDW